MSTKISLADSFNSHIYEETSDIKEDEKGNRKWAIFMELSLNDIEIIEQNDEDITIRIDQNSPLHSAFLKCKN